ncbi:hypothetical protein RFI_14095 [Reticulomyxa filosa]|uniref:Uncharacterized protein n=1 Tax=Reticulomyxa filosa TaxID=46433 RepID=X6NB02_RETFI|nr:hypothetical protein RFI_14095 [Reticulomyxa filosa]|eukprot:ETO23088.1 hypothetical protein RFI_14095 [Reticulomyxa filosa]
MSCLKEQIHDKTKELSDYKNSETKRLQETHRSNMESTNEQVELSLKQFTDSKSNHSQLEVEYKKKLKRCENELVELMNTYDHDTTQSHKQIQALQELYVTEARRLEELKRSLQELIEQRLEFEFMIANAKAQEELQRAQELAAIKIQKMYRSWKKRQIMKNDENKNATKTEL